MPVNRPTDRFTYLLTERMYHALVSLVNAVEDAMDSPKEAASWARTGDMDNYTREAISAALAYQKHLEELYPWGRNTPRKKPKK